MTAVAVLAAITVLQRVTLSSYAITPGQAESVAPLLHVSGMPAPRGATVLLTDVYLERLTPWTWLVDHLHGPVEYVPANELTAPGVSDQELIAQGYLEMRDAKDAARAAAFTTLGSPPIARALGATITGVVSNSPAARAALAVGDRVTAVNGVAVTSGCSMVRLVHHLAVGSPVRLTYRPAHFSSSGTLRVGATHHVQLTTTVVPAVYRGAVGCATAGAPKSWLGVSVEDAVGYRWPTAVTISTPNIGGPSAGLALTLGLLERLSGHSLTGGLRVAATGTIAPDGAVGDVGGVAEKTVTVQRAGAQVFLVPTVEVATARAHATPGLRVFGVSSLGQALAILHRLGGARLHVGVNG